MAILEPVGVNGVYTYVATAKAHYIVWQNENVWNLGTLDDNTINTPFKLFIQTTYTTQGRIDLITHVENYTP